MTRKFLILTAVLALGRRRLTTIAVRTTAAPQPPPPADLVLTNGKIVTVEDAMPEAQALAVRGDRIVALGSSADIRRYVGPKTQVVDLQGQLAIPGFIEGHGHFNGVGTAELQLKLMKTTSWDEIVAMVAAAVKTAKPGQWIYGRGWHQEKWTSTAGPARRGLPDACLARRGVAGQPGDPHARERPRQLRQQPRASALRHLENHAQPARRGHPQGRGGRARRACCASARPA